MWHSSLVEFTRYSEAREAWSRLIAGGSNARGAIRRNNGAMLTIARRGGIKRMLDGMKWKGATRGSSPTWQSWNRLWKQWPSSTLRKFVRATCTWIGNCVEGSTAPPSAPKTEFRPVLVDHTDIRLESCVFLTSAGTETRENTLTPRSPITTSQRNNHEREGGGGGGDWPLPGANMISWPATIFDSFDDFVLYLLSLGGWC